MTRNSNKRGPGRPEKTSAPYGEKPNLTENQWRALERELRGCRGGREGKPWPSKTPARFVAEYADVSVQIVFRWRNEDEYLRGLWWLLLKRLAAQLVRADQDDDKQRVAQLVHLAAQVASGDVDDEQSSATKCQPDDFWVEPDSSLFKLDSKPSTDIGRNAIEILARGLAEELGDKSALSLAKSRAERFRREGTADERKLWIRVANVIEVLLGSAARKARSRTRRSPACR